MVIMVIMGEQKASRLSFFLLLWVGREGRADHSSYASRFHLGQEKGSLVNQIRNHL
jgi:hypothetical protein